MTLSSFMESEEMRSPHYAVFGNPVEHSLSPLMHNAALDFHGFEARYYALELQLDELNRLASYFNADTFLGANITLPYKQVMAEYLDSVDPTAQSIGAVNTVVKKGGKLKGFNTDAYGFLAPLRGLSDELESGRAIIFGTGGASRAVVAALVGQGMNDLYLVSRTPEQIHSFDDLKAVSVISYHEWTSYAGEAALLVNTTPLGMDPGRDTSPVRETEQQYLAGRICYDVVYNPLTTRFLTLAGDVGATTVGGLEMLIHQGSRSFELWTGHSFPIDKIRNKLHDHFQH